MVADRNETVYVKKFFHQRSPGEADQLEGTDHRGTFDQLAVFSTIGGLSLIVSLAVPRLRRSVFSARVNHDYITSPE